ncbi:MAG: flagellar biosynthesis protein FlhF [Ignavibacteria bacterium]|jgi:flagellar biosynthesis protein FlhF|nr:flagellar biosynthesis protein FlhF [Ignavibacteria bacterium]MCU7503758.1 flagellar biosynthesis protein FlhF [Ignavibacteria bacterium]MCU7517228.1 flagellar biosynthesis protein FlhF [Ignavibacteria bacterium]
MQIKKYIALTLKEASQQMKSELGSNAIVLSTRIIEDDPRYGRKRVFELTAGVEDDYDKSRAESSRAAGERSPMKSQKAVPSVPLKPQPKQRTFADELKELSEKVYMPPEKEDMPFELKAQLLSAKMPVQKPAGVKKKKDTLERELKEISDTLIAREVQKSIVDVIIDQLGKYTEFLQPSNIDSYVISTISSMIPTSAFEVQKKQKTKVIALVGPTGVGKTTCIAKLAVISKILHNLNIGLISLDTFRLGAIDQLKIFSEISNIEMRVAYEPSEIPGLIAEFRKKDIVFIDTAGRSQNNASLLKETNRFLSNTKVDEIYLVLSTTSTTKNILDVAQKFKVLNYNGVVFTKLDEAVSFGNILNVTANFNVPVKYLTNGQIIPDDIIAADPQFIANMIYTGKISK